MKKRLFIGNLPATLIESDLLKNISAYGKVDSIELKEKPTGRFAFVDFTPNRNNIYDVLDQISKTRIQGNLLTVQLAKESFLSKLERERKEKQNSTNQLEVNHTENEERKPRHNIPMFKGTKFSQNEDNETIQEKNKRIDDNDKSLPEETTVAEKWNDKFEQNIDINNKQKKKRKRENNESLLIPEETAFSEKCNDKFENNNVINYKQDKKKKKIDNDESLLNSNQKNKVNAKWNDDTDNSEKGINNSTFKKRQKEQSNFQSNDKINNKKFKEKAHFKQNNLHQNPLDKKEISDLKRQNALKEKAKIFQGQKNILKQALSKIDSGNTSKKIIFDSDSEEESNINDLTHPKKDLFLEGDEDDVRDDFKRFEIKSQFKGEKGQKLLELQSRYNNDSRFTLDERFQDEEQEQEEEEENKPDGEGNIESEKKHLLELLQDILGHPVTVKSQKTHHIMQRFDPTKVEHVENFVSKKEIPEEKEEKRDKKKEKKKNDKVKKEKSAVAPVSTERFYQVDGLKSSLNKKEESFSLLQMFGNEDNIEKKEENPNKTDESIPKKKFTKLLDLAPNPFKYDSSDDEFDEIESKKNQITQHKEIKPVDGPAIFMGIRPDKFFLSPDDSRFTEAWRCFLNNSSTGLMKNEEEFSTWRRNIRGAIKLKRKSAEQKQTKQNKKKYNTMKRPQNKKNGKIVTNMRRKR